MWLETLSNTPTLDTAPEDTAPEDTAPEDTAPEDTAPEDTEATDATTPDGILPDGIARKVSSWAPLLHGEDEVRAWRSIEELAVALESWPVGVDLVPGLASGAAGLALFYAYLAEATEEDRWADCAMKYLDHMLDHAPKVAGQPSLFSGFTGVAWTLEHLKGRLLEDEDEAHHEIDARLRAWLTHGKWPWDYDLINGLAGFGVYALEILPRPAGREFLVLLLDHFEELATRLPDGITWHTSPERLPDHQRRTFPEGYYNLGLAHGVPAVANFLAALCAAEVEAPRARRLLDPTMAWLLQQRRDGDLGSCFPSWTGPGVVPETSRLAWCYGDPGIAMTLLGVAHLTGHGGWQSQAERIALTAAARPETESRVVDACLCHGSAGLGHLFHRAYRLTGHEALRSAALSWLQPTLDARRPGAGIAGYTSCSDSKRLPSRGFLIGAAGIGLALLGAVSDTDPAWDRVLMTSSRPLGGRLASKSEG